MRLRHGQLTIVDGRGTRVFGASEAPLRATLVVGNDRFYRQVVCGGGLGAAESLLEGDWKCDDLASLVRIFIRNLDLSDGLDGGFARLRRVAERWAHALRRNTRSGAQRNIRRHYDLGNELFQLFLDPTLSYSAGIFERPDATMHEASLAKLKRVADKLEVNSGDHLLEIGSGWGGLAIYMARERGCRVTTTTISREQYDLARERVREAGLADRVTVLLEDYRDLTGTYDKLVSIEMIEAVGHEYLRDYFATCARLLKPDGRLLLQAITIKEQRFEEHVRRVDFIRKHIFPGGCLPSIGAMLEAVRRSTDLRPIHLEDMTAHYELTMSRWRSAFTAKIENVAALGYDERFIRMWDYYLAYCQAGFAERQVGSVQLVFGKPAAGIDPIQWRLDRA